MSTSITEHTQRYDFCQVTYWNGNSAASPDEQWTHCMVSPLGMYAYGGQTFQNSKADIYARDSLISFLDKAYEHGRWAAKREIREALGIKEPR
jgi:hypothetical protein